MIYTGLLFFAERKVHPRRVSGNFTLLLMVQTTRKPGCVATLRRVQRLVLPYLIYGLRSKYELPDCSGDSPQIDLRTVAMLI